MGHTSTTTGNIFNHSPSFDAFYIFLYDKIRGEKEIALRSIKLMKYTSKWLPKPKIKVRILTVNFAILLMRIPIPRLYVILAVNFQIGIKKPEKIRA